MQYVICKCQVNTFKLCVWQCEIRCDNVKLGMHSKISTHDMTCNCSVVCLQMRALHVFYKNTKRSLFFSYS